MIQTLLKTSSHLLSPVTDVHRRKDKTWHITVVFRGLHARTSTTQGSPQCVWKERKEMPRVRLGSPHTVTVSGEAGLLLSTVAVLPALATQGIHLNLLDLENPSQPFSIPSVALHGVRRHWSEACQRLCLDLSKV